MGRYINATPGVASTVRTVSATYQALPNDRIMADCSGAAFTITLPAAATVLAGDVVQIYDISGNSATNNITVGRNSSNINSTAADLTVNVANSVSTLTYTNSTYGWVITSN
jgi:hypothetical protein|tara:strand:- start:1708 stop:2040 length:333 start_codon:yes stop_codon:yes gene_type:complete